MKTLAFIYLRGYITNLEFMNNILDYLIRIVYNNLTLCLLMYSGISFNKLMMSQVCFFFNLLANNTCVTKILYHECITRVLFICEKYSTSVVCLWGKKRERF